MLEGQLKHIEEQLLDKIILDSFDWLIERVGDRSVELNNTNYRKLRSPFSKKKQILLRWSYNRKELDFKRSYLALMDYKTNVIKLYCDKHTTLGFTLDSFFHEYCHSQQSSYTYAYYTRRLRVGYAEHPLEREANEFAKKMVPLYWQENSWKFESI